MPANRIGSMRVIAAFAVLVVVDCSARSLADKPSCHGGVDNCPPGWGCGPEGECVFVGGGFGGSFVDGGGGFANGGSGALGGSGAFGGSGGSAGIEGVTLGGSCEFDYECAPGLGCMRSDSGLLDAASPAKGLCSKPCSADPSVCLEFSPTAQCRQFAPSVAYCVEGCSLGPFGSETFDPNKCHGRPEMACTPVGGTNLSACLPRCNADADCKAGWYCHPRDGLCHQDPSSGLPLGESCTLANEASVDDCKGVCEPQDVATDAGIGSWCTESCTWGAQLSCGRESLAEPAEAYCLEGDDQIPLGAGPGAGDLGQCVPLCDCDDDCPSPLVCLSFGGSQLSSWTMRAGFCGTGSVSIGPCG